MRYLLFLAIMLGSFGWVLRYLSAVPKECGRTDEFRRRQIESQQSQHTDYME